MTLDAHDPSVHPVDCPECQRMTEENKVGIMAEHYESAKAPGADKKFTATQRANKLAHSKED